MSHDASNHQATTDQQTAAVPSLRRPEPAKLSNCGVKLGSKLPPRARSGSSMGSTSGWPIRACQMWPHQRSPTSNHTSAASERIVLPLCVPFVGPSHLARVQTASPICSGLAPGCRPWGPSRLLTWQHPPPAPCSPGSPGGDWPRFRPFQPLQVCSASNEAWLGDAGVVVKRPDRGSLVDGPVRPA